MKRPTKKNPHEGSNFDDFLKEEGILEEVNLVAEKEMLAYRIEQAMKVRHMSISALAAKMKTSRAVVHRLLDPRNPSVTYTTLSKAAHALGKRISFELVDS